MTRSSPIAASRTTSLPGTPEQPPELGKIFEALRPRIVRLMFLCGVPADECDDAAQQVFISVLLGLSRYDPERPFERWFMGVARNEARHYLRQLRRRPIPCGVPDGALEPADGRPDPELAAELHDLSRVLSELIEKIPPTYRRAFVMRVIEDRPVPEIAAALGVEEQTVRTRVHRARPAFDEELARRKRNGTLAVLPPLVSGSTTTKIARFFRRLLGTLGLSGAAAPSAAAPTGSAFLLLTAGGLGGAALHAALSAPPSPPVTISAIVESQPSAAPIPSDPATPPPIATAAPTATPAASAPRSSPTAGAPDRAVDLRAEQALLQRAREAIDAFQFEAARRELERHERLYPQGTLVDLRGDLAAKLTAALAARDGGAP